MMICDKSVLEHALYIKSTPLKKANEKKLTMISPITLCKLSCVCKSFRAEFIKNIYWEKLLVRDFRINQQEYSRTPKQCHKNYYEKVIVKYYKPKYESLINTYNHNIKIIDAIEHNIKTYKQILVNASVSPTFENPIAYYVIKNVYNIYEGFNPLITLPYNLKYIEIYDRFNYSIQHLTYIKQTAEDNKRKINIMEKILKKY